MIDEKEGRILHTLRVSEETDVNTKENDQMKTHVLYTGISANSWLTPIGISVKKQTASKTIGYLSGECRRTINERAKGNNGIIGRRHFELTKQLLTNEDLIIGKPICSRDECESLGKSTKEMENGDPSTFNNKGPCLAVCRPVTRSRESRISRRIRPAKSGPIVQKKTESFRPLTAPSALTTSQEDSDGLHIHQLIQPLTSHSNTPVQTTDGHLKHARHRRGGTRSAPAHGSSQKTNTGFRSTYAMREAYNLKLKQPLPASLSADTRSSTQLQYLKESVEPNNTKGLEPRNRLEKAATARESPKSSLKPLMYSKESEIRHSAGCPYQCKGCFKACLASDDFIQDKSKAHVMPNNKVAERRVILRQNKPAWRAEQKQATIRDTIAMPVWNNRNRVRLRVTRKEIPLSTYSWANGTSYPPYTKYDTLITRQVRNDSDSVDLGSTSDSEVTSENENKLDNA